MDKKCQENIVDFRVNENYWKNSNLNCNFHMKSYLIRKKFHVTVDDFRKSV